MKLKRVIARPGFTLVETLMSMGSGTMVLAAVLYAGVALQRSFVAEESYSIAEADQSRVLDYLAMDSRRAISATLSNNVLTLTIPAYYKADGSVDDPSFSAGGAIQYGTGATVTISYSKSGTNFVRSITKNGVTTTTAIATNVSSFTATTQDLTQSVSCSITFSPRFKTSSDSTSTSGTTVYCNTFFRNAAARQ